MAGRTPGLPAAPAGSDRAGTLPPHPGRSALDQSQPPDAGSVDAPRAIGDALARSVDGVAILEDGVHRTVNPAYARLFGHPDPAALEGEPWEEVIPAGQLEGLRERAAPPLRRRGSWRGEVTGRTADGEAVPLDLSLTRLDDGRLLCLARDVTEQRRIRHHLRTMALHDALTGLANRRLLRHRAEQAAQLARRHGHQIALLYLDLNDFKEVNDTLGHAAGDALLEQVAARLSDEIREADTAARVGGDEFAVLFSQVEGEDAAVRAARRVMTAFRDPFPVSDHEIELDAGAGLSLHPRHASDFEELLQQADLAMYGAGRAKEPGVRLYRPREGVVTPRRSHLVDEIHEALRHYRLELDYQPIRGVADGRIRGAEALVRWPHPRLGRLSAAKFLPLVEEAGLLQRLDRWVLARAAIQLRSWAREGFEGWLAVHLSEATWQGPGLSEMMETALSPLEGLDPRRLVVELPASDGSGGRLEEVRRELGGLGVRVALNAFVPDLGALETVRGLEPEMIILERDLVRGTRPGTSTERLLRVTVDVGHTLGARMVAKGVERPAQHELLDRAGCDLVEGYLVGWPVPAEAFPDDGAG